MKRRTPRRLRPRGLRDLARLLAHLRSRDRARAHRGLHARRLRRRDQLLRHRQRLRRRRRRDGLGRDPPRLSRARSTCSRPRSTSRCPSRTAASRAEQIAKQIDASLAPPADRLRRPLPVPPLRSGHADRGDDGGADRGRRLGQGPLPRLQRVDAGADPRRARGRGDGEVRLVPAPVQRDLARARGRALRALRRARDLADRLVAARPGSAQRQVQARRAATRPTAARRTTR